MVLLITNVSHRSREFVRPVHHYVHFNCNIYVELGYYNILQHFMIYILYTVKTQTRKRVTNLTIRNA